MSSASCALDDVDSINMVQCLNTLFMFKLLSTCYKENSMNLLFNMCNELFNENRLQHHMSVVSVSSRRVHNVNRKQWT